MIRRYTHERLNEEVRFIAGYYVPEEETRLDYNGREVLYIVGHAQIDNSCCGVAGCRYALVPGYVAEWKTETDEAGRPVSEVEVIANEGSKRDIAGILQEKEMVSQVEFW